ncbi:hypothetical protein CHS0354_029122, partial [Potamilus streckersoni]
MYGSLASRSIVSVKKKSTISPLIEMLAGKDADHGFKQALSTDNECAGVTKRDHLIRRGGYGPGYTSQVSTIQVLEDGNYFINDGVNINATVYMNTR